MVPVAPGLIEFLYQLSIDEEVGYQWRFAGSVPSREAFQQELWNGVLSQFVVLALRDKSPIGSVVAYAANLPMGFVYVGGAMAPGITGTGMGIEAFDTFFNYLFVTYPLRKIYMEVPEYNLPAFASGIGGLFKHEGCLKQHTFYAGRFWDRHTLAIYRSDYDALPRSRKRMRHVRQAPTP